MRFAVAFTILAVTIQDAHGAKGIVTCSPAPCPLPSTNNATAVYATGVKAGVRTEQLPAMRGFLNDLSTEYWSRVLVLDIGANNGNWAKSIAQLCGKLRGAPCEMAMFEPQPQFASRLEQLVTEMGGPTVARFEPAAAWRNNGTLTFFLSKNTEASSVHSSIAAKIGKKPVRTTVPTFLTWQGAPSRPTVTYHTFLTWQVRSIDLARYMRETLQLPRSDRDGVLSFVKIDVESAEYELLPHLIAEHALCGIRYLHIEWHLDALPEEKRLAGLGLTLSIHHLLQESCTRAGETPPVLVVSEESPNNNGLHIPRLRALANQHSADRHSELGRAWIGKRKAHRGRGKNKNKAKKEEGAAHGWFGWFG